MPCDGAFKKIRRPENPVVNFGKSCNLALMIKPDGVPTMASKKKTSPAPKAARSKIRAKKPAMKLPCDDLPIDRYMDEVTRIKSEKVGSLVVESVVPAVPGKNVGTEDIARQVFEDLKRKRLQGKKPKV
jgi:hypothetical protein